jgi:very-short-patch-repair endonuclease
MVSNIYNAKSQKDLRRKLRKSATSAEAVLWTHLKRRQLSGKKFRRQVSVGRYIVDFYCPECCLVVELDGSPHFAPQVDEYEEERTKYLEGLGLRVIRFDNDAVHNSVEFVLEAIREHLIDSPPRLRR